MSIMSYIRYSEIEMRRRSRKKAKIFAAVAVALAFLSFCMSVYIPASSAAYNFYESCAWRHSFMIGLMSFVPYIVLGISVYIEEKLTFLNKRIVPITVMASFFVIGVVKAFAFGDYEIDSIISFFEYEHNFGYYVLVFLLLMSWVMTLLASVFWDKTIFRIGACLMGGVYILAIPLGLSVCDTIYNSIYDTVVFLVGCLGGIAFSFALWFIGYIPDMEKGLFGGEGIVDKIKRALEYDEPVRFVPRDYKGCDEDDEDEELEANEEWEEDMEDDYDVIEDHLENSILFYSGSIVQDYQRVLAYAFTEENREIIEVANVFRNLAVKRFACENGEIYSAAHLYDCICKLCAYTAEKVNSKRTAYRYKRTDLHSVLERMIELWERDALSFKTEVCALASLCLDEDDSFWFAIGTEMANTKKHEEDKTRDGI